MGPEAPEAVHANRPGSMISCFPLANASVRLKSNLGSSPAIFPWTPLQTLDFPAALLPAALVHAQILSSSALGRLLSSPTQDSSEKSDIAVSWPEVGGRFRQVNETRQCDHLWRRISVIRPCIAFCSPNTETSRSVCVCECTRVRVCVHPCKFLPNHILMACNNTKKQNNSHTRIQEKGKHYPTPPRPNPFPLSLLPEFMFINLSTLYYLHSK